MDSISAKEVLFHLNYMGFRNISKEQLKSFMLDLKKLIKYESSPRDSIIMQVEPSVDVKRLFNTHTITSMSKLKEQQHRDRHQSQQHDVQQRERRKAAVREEPSPNDLASELKLARLTSTDSQLKNKVRISKHFPTKAAQKKPEWNAAHHDKENIPKTNVVVPPVTKPKMWIRPKSAPQLNQNAIKKTDPVSLYQSYQKDWKRFKSNICESSHSDLRWSIREKMMGNR